MRKLLFIICLSILATAVHAESTPACVANEKDKTTKSVDLRSEMPPLRDQDSVGWCYGFTAADLMSHYLYKSKAKYLVGHAPNVDYRIKKYSVSAMGIATTYNEVQRASYASSLHGKGLSELVKLKKKVFAEGGSITEALTAAIDKGFCFEKDVSSEDVGYVEDYRCAVNDHCDISDIMTMIYDTPKAGPSCHELVGIQKMFPTLNFAAIKKVLSTSARENAISNLVNASCQKHLATSIFQTKKGPDMVSLTLANGHSTHELMTAMDSQLDKGIPVGIMYFGDVLLNPAAPHGFYHASTIVGKRFNKATCEVEYILRNSWGEGCGIYRQENPHYLVCIQDLKYLFSAKDNDKKAGQTYFDSILACRKNNPEIQRNPRIACEDSSSHVIIRKSDLEKSVYNITSIKEDENYFTKF